LPEARPALELLCAAYWYPLYAHVRRRGYSADEAQDHTQQFFADILQRQALRAADQARGRFRSFLLAALDHFLANERRRGQAQKRGGGQRPLPLDFDTGESRYLREPVHSETPEREFLRRWAIELLGRSLDHLRDEYRTRGRLELFEELKAHLSGDSEAAPHAEIAARLGMTAGAVKTALSRLRRRCRELLREEIAQTVAAPGDVDDELRELLSALSAH
jgi:RNA polymerase sigma-70 factor (ECF subfamily)